MSNQNNEVRELEKLLASVPSGSDNPDDEIARNIFHKLLQRRLEKDHSECAEHIDKDKDKDTER